MNTAQICAALSKMSYGTPTLADVVPLGLTWVENYEAGASQATLAGDGRTVYLAFRGTEEALDLLTDFRYVKTDWRYGGRVHAGFEAAFWPLWAILKPELDRLDPKLHRVYTGHSLGAALAQLAASAPGYLHEMHLFGCPKVGNDDFVKLITCPTWRYEAKGDPVPHVPPPTSFLQAVWALGHFRRPTLYSQPGITVGVDSWGHGMDGYSLAA